MKKRKITLTVIKESDGSFSMLGQAGKSHLELIATQAETWEELKENALETLNKFLEGEGKAPVTSTEIDFSFDLPSFFDAYPQLNLSALAKQPGMNKSAMEKQSPGRKKAADRQVHRILAAVKELGSDSAKKLPAKR